jgi:SAM-dependent methyltransferase
MRRISTMDGRRAGLEIDERRGTNIRYEHYDSVHRFEEYLRKLILESGATTICEIGSGRNPALNLDFVRSQSLKYMLVDASESELEKADPEYSKMVADITDEDFEPLDRYDLVFSRMLAEHVRDPEAFHRNVHSSLLRGGLAVHFFPTLYALPFLVNRLLPEALSEWILQRGWPERSRGGDRPKFPARYGWCYGPTRKQLERFTRIGYEVEEYVGFFGHGYYDRIKPLRALSRRATSYWLAHPNAHLTSYAYVVLRRAA